MATASAAAATIAFAMFCRALRLCLPRVGSSTVVPAIPTSVSWKILEKFHPRRRCPFFNSREAKTIVVGSDLQYLSSSVAS